MRPVVADGEAGWPIWVAANAGLADAPSKALLFYSLERREKDDSFIYAEQSQAANWLADQKNAERLRKLVAAVLAHPRLAAGGVPFEELRLQVQQAAFFAKAEAVRAVRAGEAAEAERATRAAIAAAAVAADVEPTLAGLHRGDVLFLAAMRPLRAGLDARLWSDDQLARLDAALGRTDPQAARLRAIDGQRLHDLDLVQRMFTDKGAGGGRVTPAAVEVAAWGGSRAALEYLGMPTSRLLSGTPSLLMDVLAGPLVLHLSPRREEVIARIEATAAAARDLARSEQNAAEHATTHRTLDGSRTPWPQRLRLELEILEKRRDRHRMVLKTSRGLEANRLTVHLAIAAERSRLASEDARSPATDAETREASF